MEEGSRRPAEKAATIITMLGAENAAAVFKYLKESEIEQISVELTRLPKVRDEELQVIAKEFHDCCLTQKVITEGGQDYAKEVLEKTFGPQQAKNLMDRVGKALKVKSFAFLRKVDYKSLMTVVQNEHPQTLALILSYASPDQASRIIENLPRDVRTDVVERVARMERAVPNIVHIVESVVESKLDTSASEEMMEIGGLNYVADIMNNVDRSTEKDIFDDLTLKDAPLADSVRKLMFVFEDIASLDPMSIQRFIREVDAKDLAVALKATNQDVKNAIFSNMSTRMRDNIRTDIEYLHNIRMSDVQTSQQRIVSTIRRLEENGDIVISKDGKDDFIV